MVCCFVSAVLLGTLSRWRALITGHDLGATIFPPVAFRPGPGESYRENPFPSESPMAKSVPEWRRAITVATLGYLIFLAALLATPLAAADGSLSTWVGRSAVLVLFGGRAWELPGRTASSVPPLASRMARPLALVVGGGYYFLLGIIDMHVLGLVDLGDSPLVDFIFHAPGLVASWAGAAALVARTAGNGRSREPVPSGG